MTTHTLDALLSDFRAASAERFELGANLADSDWTPLRRLAEDVCQTVTRLSIRACALDVARPRHSVDTDRLRDVLTEAVADELHLTPEAARVFAAMVRGAE